MRKVEVSKSKLQKQHRGAPDLSNALKSLLDSSSVRFHHCRVVVGDRLKGYAVGFQNPETLKLAITILGSSWGWTIEVSKFKT